MTELRINTKKTIYSNENKEYNKIFIFIKNMIKGGNPLKDNSITLKDK